ncbi:MAG: 3'(2'),5'-bisphosphate nucleotidase CysQ [Bacteroidetes bacterium]|nr:3'(2'),5'-bisphosphate nucleotidase CysQ [Bacteroidota bacterium]
MPDNKYLSNEGLLSLAIQAAMDAAIPILEIYRQEFTVEMKADNSPLTLADKASHHTIMERLASSGIPVLSEEGRAMPYEERKDWEYLWIVDPLDGTKEFIKKNDEFTVNIALVRNGKPELGVIYVPVLKELYFAAPEFGSWKVISIQAEIKTIDIHALIQSGKRLPVAQSARPFTIVASRSHLNQETQSYIDEILQKFPDAVMISRGSSLKLCQIAEGAADIYPRFAPTMEWDTAAGQAIITHSGGFVNNMESGEEMTYNKENLLNPWFIAGRK